MDRWLVSFAADALKRLVICNRIIRPTSGTIDRSIPPPPPPRALPALLPRHRPVSLRECRDREAHSDRLRNGTGTGIISVHGKSDFYLGTRPPAPPRVLPLASPRALFIRAHIRTYKIFREFFSGNPRGARPQVRSSEHREEQDGRSGGQGADGGIEENYCWLSESRANEPCSLHFPIVITLLVISSLWRGRLFCFCARWSALRAFQEERGKRGRDTKSKRGFEILSRAYGISCMAVERRIRLVYRNPSYNALLLNCERPSNIDFIFAQKLPKTFSNPPERFPGNSSIDRRLMYESWLGRKNNATREYVNNAGHNN